MFPMYSAPTHVNELTNEPTNQRNNKHDESQYFLTEVISEQYSVFVRYSDDAVVSILYMQCESKKSRVRFSGIFHKRLDIFSPNFTSLLYVPIYVRLQIFIQLAATLTKLCHIKRDHHHMLKMFTIARKARWHNFVTVGDN